MNASDPPVPRPQPGPVSAGWLTPRSWRLEEGSAAAEALPAGADALPTEANGGAPPWLLLLDRRQPIGADVRADLAASLSAAERQRLQAYRLADDRDRFLLGRGGLRQLLGCWLDLAPEAVPLESGPHGKPHCPGGPAFNISHSGDLILLGLHPRRALGVDVEHLRPDLDWQAIARRMLPASERQALEDLPEGARPEGFLAAWCRLEARLKARGDGLAGLERLRAERGPAPQSASSAGAEQLWDVAVPKGYRAAVTLAPQHAC